MKPLSEKRPDRRDAILRAAVLLFCVLLNTFTLVRAVLRGEPYWVRCLVGYVLLLLPLAAERLFSFRMKPFVFIPMQLFVLAAVLGKCYRLFYICPVWDVLTHFWGGAELAVCGAFL
ncbi:MAG: hypothetical protein ILO68_07555, partial [Clostridia bacterium]|nr:hypothetical protein [Clostridia bacterium]